jgi:hypothetical protein
MLCVASHCSPISFKLFSGLNRNFEYLVVRWCVVKHVMRYKTFCPQGVVCQDKVVSSNVVWFIYMKSWNHFHKTRLSGLSIVFIVITTYLGRNIYLWNWYLLLKVTLNTRDWNLTLWQFETRVNFLGLQNAIWHRSSNLTYTGGL